jgi:hypothetical protein
MMDIDTLETYSCTPDNIDVGVKLLMKADMIIGHNVIDFDIPAIKKVYPWFDISETKVRDTLVMSYLLWPNLSDLDSSQKKQAWPSRPLEVRQKGSHSLKAWGHRLGYHKLDYTGGWAEWSPDMQYYCEVDVEVTERLWKLIESKEPSEKSVELEHQVRWAISRQERYGVRFDTDAANNLVRMLMKRRAELEAELQDAFPPWTIEEVFIPKVNNLKRGYEKGVPFIKKTTVVFNPNSRDHIADRLTALYGWKPTERTEGGKVKVDETVLEHLPYPPAKGLSELLLIQKRLGMVAEGKQSWFGSVKNGRIHGRVLTNFTVTGRASHRNPNLAQVPAVGSPYGKECRACFTASTGRKLVGVDVSGLELRMLAHFMAAYDGGEYGRTVVEGDVHTDNMKAAGLQNRNQAKTFIYAFLYGAGPGKIGSIVGGSAKDGNTLRNNFLKKTPALHKLLTAVKSVANRRGYLIGLDGRHLHIRSEHSALNVLLQSAGALICKRWVVEVDNMIKERGWSNKVNQVLFVHDECQFDCDPDIAEEFAQAAIECISKAQVYFNITVPLTGEAKIGANWADTH